MRPGSFVSLIVWLLLAWAACAERLPMRFVTTADGLARDDVHAVLQDRAGMLWFATSEGVSRFDGEKFRTFRVSDGVPGRDVHSILQSKDGTIWMATSGGIAYFDPNATSRPNAFIRVSLGMDGGVDRMMQDRTGAVWAGSYLGLFRIRPGSRSGEVKRFDLRNEAGESLFAHEFAGAPDPHAPIYAILQDRAGTIWVGTSRGLFAGANDGSGEFVCIPEMIGYAVHSMAEDGNGRLWVGTGAGLIRAKYEQRKFEIERRFTVEDGLPDNFVKSVLVTSGRQLWVGTTSGLAQLVSPGPEGDRFKAYAIAGGLSYGDIESVAEDSAQNLWVATNGGGAIKITVGGFVTYDERDGFGPAYVGSVGLDRDGFLLVLTASKGKLTVYRSDGTRFTGYTLGEPPGSAPTFWTPWHQVMVESRTGAWWAVSYQGLLRYTLRHGSGPVTLRPDRILSTANGLRDNQVLHVLEDSKGRLWVATYSGGPMYSTRNPIAGFTVLDPASNASQSYSEADGLPPLGSFIPGAIYEDRSGQIWIGMHRTGAARLRNGRFEVFTAREGVPFGGIRQFYQDRQGHLWLASTSGGLGRVEDPTAEKLKIRIFTTRDGLSSDEIQTITEDLQGRIYAGTGIGVDRLDPETGRVRHFTAADGLAPGEVQDSVRDKNGDLWFGTLTGLSRLTPGPDPPALSLPSRITGLRIAGHPRSLDDEGVTRLELPDLHSDENNIEVDFGSVSWAEPLFQYHLEGATHSDWSAPTALRTVLYSNLRDGRYRFFVRAVNNSGIAGEPAEMTFRILPPIWERWWFLSALALLLAVAGTLAYRYRIAHLLEIERMRTRFACDIHDDVGAAISKIIIMSDVAQRREGEKAAPVLAQISATSRQILDGISDMVAAINPHTDRWEDMVSRMREFGTQIFEARDVSFEFQGTDLPMQRKVKPEILRHLYLIYKELVNNAAKHSGCTRAAGTLRMEGANVVVLEVVDNGCGFDGTPKRGRNGMANLKQRAGELNGTVEWSRESGTRVTVRIPLHDRAGWRRWNRAEILRK